MITLKDLIDSVPEGIDPASVEIHIYNSDNVTCYVPELVISETLEEDRWAIDLRETEERA
jgi:hypothetical protein